jgi:hypothetical protein
MAYSHERTRAGRGEEKATERVRTLEATYTYGLAENFDIYVGVSHARWRAKAPEFDEDTEEFTGFAKESASGLGNTAIGAKWRFFDDEESGTSLAIVPEIVLPVSSQREEDGLGTGRASGSLTFVLTQSVPFGSLYFNAGIGRDRYRHDDNETTRSFSVAPVWEISEQWKVAFDVGVDSTRAGGHTVRTKFSDITAVFAASEDVEVSIAYSRATDNDDPRSKTNAVTIGVAWAF